MAASFHVACCSFLRLSCRSDHELFSSSYVRSNKKRSSKLLRCFPHCCPDHAPRSYCGCSLHVLVTFESVEDAVTADQNEDLVVCARFESTANGATSRAGDVVSALQPDDIVALPSSALLPSGDTESDWVRAEKAGDSYQQKFPENAILYVLNNHRNPQWYYGYDSGSTKTQREMKHVLAVYALVLHPLSDRRSTRGASLPIARLGTVIARHPSPSFTMVSYRRQSNVCRRKRENAQDLGATQALDENAEGPTGGAATDEREPSASQSEDIDRAGFATAQALRSMVPERATSHLQVDAECDGAVTFQADSRAFDELGAADDDEAGNPFSSIPPLGQESPCCHFCLGPLLEPPHARQDTMERLQLMLLVLLFMRSTPLGDFSFHFSKMDSQIRRNWLSNLSQFEQLRQGEESSAHELLTHIRSSFSLAYFVSKRSHSDVGHSGREQAVLRSCANLLFDAFSSTRVQQILESASVTQVDERGQERTVPGSCEHFGHLIADLFDELTSLLDNRSDPRAAALSRDDINYGHSTIPHIVDDILSLVYAAPKYRSLRTTTSALLLRKNDALETAARRLFRACELQQAWNSSIQRLDRCSDSTPADHARDQPDVQQEKAVHNLPTPSNDKWTGRWFLEPTSISITPVSSQMGADYGSAMTLATGPSLLSVLGLIRIFASIDLALENLQLSVGSSIRGTGRKRAVFVLDGQAHPIKTLPNDVVVAAGVALFGDCWGLNEYQGRVSDDRISIDLLLLVKTSSRHSDRIGASSFDQRVYLHVALEDERDGEKGFSVSAEITTEWGTPSRQHSRLSNVHGLSCSSTLKAHSVFVGTA